MLSGSECQMGQEAGLAGVAAMDRRAEESPSSAACTVHSGEELAVDASHFSPPALNLGPSFEGKVAKPAKSQGCFPLHLEPARACPKACQSLLLQPDVCPPTLHTGSLHICCGCLKTGQPCSAQKPCTQYSLGLGHLSLFPNCFIVIREIFVFLLQSSG